MNETSSPNGDVIYKQLSHLDIPISHNLLADISHVLTEGFKGKSDAECISGTAAGRASYNCIPGIPGTPCFPELVVYCFDKDSLTERMAKLVDHITSACPSTERAVLVTSRWIPGIWRRNEEAIRRAHTSVFVLLVTPYSVVQIV